MRTVSAVLLTAFVCQDLAWASAEIKLSLPAEFRPITGLRLPESIARIEEVSLRAKRSNLTAEIASSPSAPRNDNEKTIFLIQDAHTNPSAQLNIARSLEILLEQEKIGTVFVEGGFGDVSLSHLRPKASAAKREEVAMRYLRKGELSGAELLNLTSERDFRLSGVEDEALYWKSIDAYRAVAKDRERFKTYLENAERTVGELKPEVLNPLLRTFDRIRGEFLDQKMPWTDYFEKLRLRAQWFDVPFDAYPALEKIERLKKMEGAIDFAKANEEAAEAVQTLPVEERARLFEFTSNKHTATKLGEPKHRNEEAFYSALEVSLRGASAPKQSMLELFKYFDYLRESRWLDMAKLLEEQGALEEALLQRLVQSDEESKLIRIGDAVRRLKALFDLTLTADEFRKLESEPDFHKLKEFTRFLNTKIMDLEDHYDRVLFLDEAFEKTLEKAKEFYRLTRERDEVFLKKIFARMAETGEEKAVLLAGGYHAEHLKSLFQEKDVSFISILPQVLHETNAARYEKLLLGQSSVIASPPQAGEAISANKIPLLAVQSRPPDPENPILTGARLAAEFRPGSTPAAKKPAVASPKEPIKPPALTRTEGKSALILFAAMYGGLIELMQHFDQVLVRLPRLDRLVVLSPIFVTGVIEAALFVWAVKAVVKGDFFSNSAGEKKNKLGARMTKMTDAREYTITIGDILRAYPNHFIKVPDGLLHLFDIQEILLDGLYIGAESPEGLIRVIKDQDPNKIVRILTTLPSFQREKFLMPKNSALSFPQFAFFKHDSSIRLLDFDEDLESLSLSIKGFKNVRKVINGIKMGVEKKRFDLSLGEELWVEREIGLRFLGFHHGRPVLDLATPPGTQTLLEGGASQIGSSYDTGGRGARLADTDDPSRRALGEALAKLQPTLESLIHLVQRVSAFLTHHRSPHAKVAHIYAQASNGAEQMKAIHAKSALFAKGTMDDQGKFPIIINVPGVFSRISILKKRWGPLALDAFIAEYVPGIVQESFGYVYLLTLSNLKEYEEVMRRVLEVVGRSFSQAGRGSDLMLLPLNKAWREQDLFPSTYHVTRTAAYFIAAEIYESRIHHNAYRWLKENRFFEAALFPAKYYAEDRGDEAALIQVMLTLGAQQDAGHLFRDETIHVGAYVFFLLLQAALWLETEGQIGMHPSILTKLKHGEAVTEQDFRMPAVALVNHVRDIIDVVGGKIGNIEGSSAGSRLAQGRSELLRRLVLTAALTAMPGPSFWAPVLSAQLSRTFSAQETALADTIIRKTIDDLIAGIPQTDEKRAELRKALETLSGLDIGEYTEEDLLPGQSKDDMIMSTSLGKKLRFNPRAVLDWPADLFVPLILHETRRFFPIQKARWDDPVMGPYGEFIRSHEVLSAAKFEPELLKFVAPHVLRAVVLHVRNKIEAIGEERDWYRSSQYVRPREQPLEFFLRYAQGVRMPVVKNRLMWLGTSPLTFTWGLEEARVVPELTMVQWPIKLGRNLLIAIAAEESKAFREAMIRARFMAQDGTIHFEKNGLYEWVAENGDYWDWLKLYYYEKVKDPVVAGAAGARLSEGSISWKNIADTSAGLSEEKGLQTPDGNTTLLKVHLFRDDPDLTEKVEVRSARAVKPAYFPGFKTKRYIINLSISISTREDAVPEDVILEILRKEDIPGEVKTAFNQLLLGKGSVGSRLAEVSKREFLRRAALTGAALLAPSSPITGLLFADPTAADRTRERVHAIIDKYLKQISEKDRNRDRRALRMGFQALSEYDLEVVSENGSIPIEEDGAFAYTDTVTRTLKVYPPYEQLPSQLQETVMIHEATHAERKQAERNTAPPVLKFIRALWTRTLDTLSPGEVMQGIAVRIESEFKGIANEVEQFRRWLFEGRKSPREIFASFIRSNPRLHPTAKDELQALGRLLGDNWYLDKKKFDPWMSLNQWPLSQDHSRNVLIAIAMSESPKFLSQLREAGFIGEKGELLVERPGLYEWVAGNDAYDEWLQPHLERARTNPLGARLADEATDKLITEVTEIEHWQVPWARFVLLREYTALVGFLYSFGQSSSVSPTVTARFDRIRKTVDDIKARHQRWGSGDHSPENLSMEARILIHNAVQPDQPLSVAPVKPEMLTAFMEKHTQPNGKVDPETVAFLRKRIERALNKSVTGSSFYSLLKAVNVDRAVVDIEEMTARGARLGEKQARPANVPALRLRQVFVYGKRWASPLPEKITIGKLVELVDLHPLPGTEIRVARLLGEKEKGDSYPIQSLPKIQDIQLDLRWQSVNFVEMSPKGAGARLVETSDMATVERQIAKGIDKTPTRYEVNAPGKTYEVISLENGGHLRVQDLVVMDEKWAKPIVVRSIPKNYDVVVTQGPQPYPLFIAPILAAMQQQDWKGRVVEDYGTGNGVLMLAALKLGAKRVIGFERNPEQLRKALRALRRAGHRGRVVRMGSVETGPVKIPSSDDFILITGDAARWLQLDAARRAAFTGPGKVVRIGNLGYFNAELLEELLDFLYKDPLTAFAILGGYLRHTSETLRRENEDDVAFETANGKFEDAGWKVDPSAIANPLFGDFAAVTLHPPAGARLARRRGVVEDDALLRTTATVRLRSFFLGVFGVFGMGLNGQALALGAMPGPAFEMTVSGNALTVSQEGRPVVAVEDLTQAVRDWRLERSQRQARLSERAKARSAFVNAHKRAAALMPAREIGELKGFVEITAARLSEQLSDDAAFIEAAGLLSEIMAARHGNYYVSGTEELSDSRLSAVRNTLSFVGKRALVTLERPERTAITKLLLVRDGMSTENAEDELAVQVAAFEEDTIPPLEAGLAIAEIVSHEAAQRLDAEGRIPVEGENYDDLVKAWEQGPVPQAIAQLSEGGVKPPGKELFDYLKQGKNAYLYILKPLVRYPEELAEALKHVRTVDFSA